MTLYFGTKIVQFSRIPSILLGTESQWPDFGWTFPTMPILRDVFAVLKGKWVTKKKFAILLPSQDITCESLDCDEDIYLPYVSSSFFLPQYLSTVNLDFRRSMVMD